MVKNRKKKIALVVVLAVTGFLLLLCGALFEVIFNAILKYEMQKVLPLKEGGLTFKIWQAPPVPVAFKVYVFDIQNPEQVLEGKTPLVMEKGPYVFNMSIKKIDVVRHDENDSLSYRQPLSFVFNPEASAGPLSDTFHTLNIPLTVVASQVSSWPAFVQKAVNDLMKLEGETGLKKLSIEDIFWGYNDPVLHQAYELLKFFNIHLPFLHSKFGFFTGKNNTDDGVYNVFSGVSGNLDNYCVINTWKGKKDVGVWTTDEANTIYGGDGSMHPPYMNSDSKVALFDSFMQRSLSFKYKGGTSYKGLDLLHYVMPFSDFANASVNPDNAGFCTPDINHCIPSGCYNLTAAAFGAPMYVSMPHFCGADPYYRNLVHGLHPNHKKHQPYYDIYGLTGVTVRGARRYQINIRTDPHEYFTPLKNFPKMYMPVMWIDAVSLMGDSDVSTFRDQIQAMVHAVPYIQGSMIGVGFVLFLVACCLAFYWFFKNKKTKDDIASSARANSNYGAVNRSPFTDTENTTSETDPLIENN